MTKAEELISEYLEESTTDKKGTTIKQAQKMINDRESSWKAGKHKAVKKPKYFAVVRIEDNSTAGGGPTWFAAIRNADELYA